MKRKLFAIILIIALLCTNYGFVFAYTRGTDGVNINTRSTAIPENPSEPLAWIDGDYKAHSQKVTHDKIKVYKYTSTTDYSTSTEITLKDSSKPTEKFLFTEDSEHYYLGDIADAFKNIGNVINSTDDQGNQRPEDFQAYNMQMAFPIGQTCKDVVTIVYKDYIICNNKKYDLKVDISEVRSTRGASDTESDSVYFTIPLGIRNLPAGYTYFNEEVSSTKVKPTSENDPTAYNLSTYDLPTQFNIVMNPGLSGKGGHAEADIKYTFLDGSNNAPVSSIFVFTDIDKNQGIVVKNFVADKPNTFIPAQTFIFNQDYPLNVKTTDDIDTFFYATNPKAAEQLSDIYILKEKTSSISTTGTWDNISAGFQLVLKDNLLGDAVKVTFDSKGGNYEPDDQKLKPGTTATRPRDPEPSNQRTGYRFKGWKIKGSPDSEIFNFNTPINVDTDLEGVWETENPWTISYDLHVYGTNTEKNIQKTQYYPGDTFTFDPAVPNEGYNFLGWYTEYTDGNYSNPITEIIPTTTGNLVLHAKWEKINDPTPVEQKAKYIVQHYKEGADGKYTLEATENGEGKIGSTATAQPQQFNKYHVNKSHPETIETATIKEDGSTVLKLYYDKDDVKVTFIPQNGENNTTVTLKYEDKVKEPTDPKYNGYEFKYWYYKDTNGKEVRYNFDTPVTDDIELYAKWDKIEKDLEPTPTPTPTPSPSTPSNNDGKKDDTTATTPIPKTGQFSLGVAILISIIVICGATFAIGLFKSKKIK